MSQRRLLRLPAITTFAVLALLGLVACGSAAEETSTETVDRQAGMAPDRVAKLCLYREANAGPMTVNFLNSELPQGNGPFNLDYVQCGESPINGPIRMKIMDSQGNTVLYMQAMNVNIGYPAVYVKFLDKEKGVGESFDFSEGETHDFNVGPYSVRVERQNDTDKAKNFYASISKP